MKLIAALHPIFQLSILFAILSNSGACSSPEPHSSSFKPGIANYDTAPVSLDAIETNPKTQQKILSMSFGEAVARLSSLQFNATANFSFTQGATTVQQDNQYSASQDALGNFHVRSQTPTSSIEAYQVGADFFIRHGSGNLRKKPRRDIASEQWGQQVFASLNETLQIFRPHLQFKKSTASQYLGRKALKVELGLSSQIQPSPLQASELPTSQVEIAMPSQWRDLARPLAISGNIWIDEQSGVVVRSNIAGKLEISDRDVRPTQLEITYESSITDIGKVRPIQAPDSIEEHRRTKPPRNLVKFMNKHLPKTQPNPDAPKTDKPL